MLETFKSCHGVVVGMGHEPDLRSAVVVLLKQLRSEFEKVVFSIVPIFQTRGHATYVEYMLCGRGSDFPHEWVPTGWIGPAPSVIEKGARIQKRNMSSQR